MTTSIIRANEPSETIEAQRWLAEHDMPFLVCNATHIKIGKINFYPTTGRLTVDGEGPAHNERGMEALKRILIKHGYPCSRSGQPIVDHATGSVEIILP